METKVSKGNVLSVNNARPFLEEKLRQLELDLAGIQDFGELSQGDGFRQRTTTLLKHREDYQKQHRQLQDEFQNIFRDYVGYESPPVLKAHPVFKKMEDDVWIPETDNQYLLGSLDIDEGGSNRIAEWCTHLDMLENQVAKLNHLIWEFQDERNRRLEGGELEQLEQMVEQQKILIKETTNLQQDNQKQLKHDQRLLQQQKKSVSERLKTLKLKEEENLLHRQKLAEDQALLLAREEILNKNEEDLQKNCELLKEASELIRKEAEGVSKEVTRLEVMIAEMNKINSENTNNNETDESSSILKIINTHQSLIEQQQQVLKKLETAETRLSQDKSWIKSLIKGLLNQQEKFQHVEDRIREREREDLIRKKDDLQQERGWIKVEKAKMRKTKIQDEVVNSSIS